MAKTLKDLKANPNNPRKASEEKLSQLRKTTAEFGDLSGIILNRTTGNLVGGHQRIKVFPKKAEVKILKTFLKPTKIGTIAYGYVLVNGERFTYREVQWDDVKEKAAMIAANKNAGEWDLETLSGLMREIDEFGMDLDLTMHDEDERADLLTPTVSPNFKPGSEEDQAKLDEKKKQICPHCGEAFTVGGRV